MEESFILGDAQDFVLLKLAGKKSIFHYTAEVMNDFDENEYKIRYYKWIENTNKFILDKINISAFLVLTYEGSFHSLYQQDHPNGKGHSCVFQWILVDSM
jgi:hypothetical protein